MIMIVTGGGRGIGAATARLAAKRGYAVCVNYLGNAEAAEAVVRDIEGAGGRAIAVQADVAAEAEVESLFETVDRELGQLTALVNNAGLAGRIGRLDAAPSTTIRQVIEVNLFGTIWCARGGPAHVEPPRRPGRGHRQRLLGRGDPGQSWRIRLVRRLEGCGR